LQYTKILQPTKDLTTRVVAEATDRFAVLHTVQYGAEWKRRNQKQKDEQQAAMEKDRVAYQSIDWHDFLIVETVEFLPEDTDLPPPIQMADLGARIIEIENLERAKKEKERSAPTGETDTQAMEMDMEDSSDEEPEAAAPAPAAPAVIAPPEEIKIRAYDPKAKAAASGAPKGDTYLISPLTGEK
jgi:splicing factor 3A subunit 1